MKNKKGMSLIVLVITIIVMIVLAGVVVIGLTSNNPIAKANEATFKSDAGNFKQELSLNLAKRFSENPTIVNDDINASTLEEIKEYIPSFSDKYEGVFEIKNGELVYIGEQDEQKNWSADINVDVEEQESDFMQYFSIEGHVRFFQSNVDRKNNEILIGGEIYENQQYMLGAIVADTNGNKLKEKFLNVEARFGDCAMLQNGNYVMIGYTPDNNGIVLILDNNLNIIKENRVIGNHQDMFTKVLQLPNGDIIALMQMASDDLGINNPRHCASVIYKYNQQGDFIERKDVAPFFNGYQISPADMKMLTSGEVVISGSTNYGYDTRRFVAVKFNPNTLEPIYQKYYNSDATIECRSFTEAENGCIVISGIRNYPYNGTIMLKIDAQGNEILRKYDRFKPEAESTEYQTTIDYIDGKLVTSYYINDDSEPLAKVLMVTYNSNTLERENYFETSEPYERIPNSMEKIGDYYYHYANEGYIKKFKIV